MKKRLTILGVTVLMALGVLVGCGTKVQAPEKEPEKQESVEQNTTITEVKPTEIGEEFPE